MAGSLLCFLWIPVTRNELTSAYSWVFNTIPKTETHHLSCPTTGRALLTTPRPPGLGLLALLPKPHYPRLIGLVLSTQACHPGITIPDLIVLGLAVVPDFSSQSSSSRPRRPGLIVPASPSQPCCPGLAAPASLYRPRPTGLAIPASPYRPCHTGLAVPASPYWPCSPGLAILHSFSWTGHPSIAVQVLKEG